MILFLHFWWLVLGQCAYFLISIPWRNPVHIASPPKLTHFSSSLSLPLNPPSTCLYLVFHVVYLHLIRTHADRTLTDIASTSAHNPCKQRIAADCIALSASNPELSTLALDPPLPKMVASSSSPGELYAPLIFSPAPSHSISLFFPFDSHMPPSQIPNRNCADTCLGKALKAHFLSFCGPSAPSQRHGAPCARGAVYCRCSVGNWMRQDHCQVSSSFEERRLMVDTSKAMRQAPNIFRLLFSLRFPSTLKDKRTQRLEETGTPRPR